MINKSIDLSVLPIWKKGEGNHKEGFIKWVDSIGYKVPFMYDSIEGTMEIVDYNSKSQYLTIEYNNNIYSISIKGFVKCHFGKILGKITKEFKIEIGTVLKNKKRDLIIIDREYRKNEKNGQNCKWYKYYCNKCGYNEGWIIESGILTKNVGCSCCSGGTVVKGINDISTTNPCMLPYFVNIEDAYTHTCNSDDKVLVKCLDCGHEKLMRIANLHKRGFSCPKCSDKLSYCEKFVFNLLDILKQNKQLEDYIYQYTKLNETWVDSYRYDFYFELNKEKYIIETHGEQHYKENKNFNSTLKEIQQNDKNKYDLAISNGIKPNNYIVIDCRKNDLKWLKSNIINSRLNEIFNLEIIDFVKISRLSQKNKIKEVCDYWYVHNNLNNKGLTTTNLSEIFKVDRNTIRNWLKLGVELNWCNYNAKEESSKIAINNGKNNLGKRRKNKKNKRVKEKTLVLCENNKFNTVKECAEYYQINNKTMAHWLNHDCKMPKKFYDMELHYSNESMDNYDYFEVKDKKEKLKNINGNKQKKRKVICITTGKVFNKIVDGARYYNCNSDSITSCCKGRNKSCGKLQDGTRLHWKYIDDLTKEEYIKYDIENKLKELK